MTWPQWFMISIIATGAFYDMRRVWRDRDLSSSVVTAALFAVLLYWIAIVAVLYAGDFW